MQRNHVIADSSRNSEDRGQRAEGRGQRAEGRGQRTDARVDTALSAA